MECAWRTAYATAAAMMMDAAEDSRRASAWWTGEIVEHELRRPDIAALTVRPDRTLPYRGGPVHHHPDGALAVDLAAVLRRQRPTPRRPAALPRTRAARGLGQRHARTARQDRRHAPARPRGRHDGPGHRTPTAPSSASRAAPDSPRSKRWWRRRSAGTCAATSTCSSARAHRPSCTTWRTCGRWRRARPGSVSYRSSRADPSFDGLHGAGAGRTRPLPRLVRPRRLRRRSGGDDRTDRHKAGGPGRARGAHPLRPARPLAAGRNGLRSGHTVRN